MKPPFPYAELAVSLLRAAAPLDFPRSLPIYTIALSEIGPNFKPKSLQQVEGHCPNWKAYTGMNTDLEMSLTLHAAGEWRGRGFAAVFHDQRFRSRYGQDVQKHFQAGLEMLLHEAAHRIEFLSSPLRLPAQKVFQYLNRTRADPALADYAASGNHGGRFVRAALHLHHRMKALHPVTLEGCSIGGKMYGLPEPELFRIALLNEPEHRKHESISSILQDDSPRTFSQFWREICSAAG